MSEDVDAFLIKRLVNNLRNSDLLRYNKEN
jgi:hypothetical protein